MTDAEKKEVKLANKKMSNAELKRVAENALTRVEAENRTKKYYENQKKKPPGGLRAQGLRKLKEKVTGKSKGGMAKRKAKK